jgi:hypothetical protein
MNEDFPAAHSMDTRWYAADGAGHLGIFDSGENGHIPDLSTGDAFELIDELWRRMHSTEGDSPWESEDRAAKLGVFFYEYDDANFDPIAPYKRTAAPKEPLHVDQLPPTLRKQVKEAQLAKGDFAPQPLLQPLELYPCVYWYEENRVACPCSDGKTVRAIPGKEDRFADFCRQFREEHPEQAKDMIFEGLKDEPD